MKRPLLFLLLLLLVCVLLPKGARAQTFNPADYGNVSLYLKADTLSLSNNAPVTAWGSLTTASPATPLYIAADARFNGKPVVKFDGVDDVLKWTGALVPARTIFAVLTVESASVTLSGLISTGGDKLNIRRNGTANNYRAVGLGADANDFTGVGTPTGNLYVNNVLNGNFTPGVAHLVMAVAGTQQVYSNLWVGTPGLSGSTVLQRFLNGSVAEILIYDGVLSAEATNRVGYYLQTKYNLPTTFPPPTPLINSFSATAAGPITSSAGVTSAPGAPVTLKWNVANTVSLSIDNGALSTSSAATGSLIVSPTVTTTYTLSALNPAGSLTRSLTVYVGTTPLPAGLNEFVAASNGDYPDEDGDKSDWIEIYNPNPFALDLQGYQLKDGLLLWSFPAGSVIEAKGYRVVFASGKNRIDPAANLHTNFSLNSSGEYLALLKPDGTVATEFAPAFPAQSIKASAGLNANGVPVIYTTQTPGAANSTGYLDFVKDTVFSLKRGFYSTPIQVSITTATLGASIRYTLDASTPSETNGLFYTGPISVNATSTLRARAFLANYAPTDTDTQTYLFLTDVLTQTYPSTPPSGWPVSGVNSQVLRYGWNSVLKAQYSDTQILDGLRQISSLSIVTDQANLTSAASGIYVNALQKSDLWEHAASIEYLPADSSPGFHIDAGLRIRGGASRNPGYPKHSFRLYFHSSLGAGTLKFPLHGTTGTDTFNTLDLRTEENYHWANDTGTQNTAVREVFCRDLMGALGYPTTRTRYLHLYLNGQYWGLYETEERAQQDYGATYFGGSSADYDVLQTSNHPLFTYEVGSGNVTAWQNLWTMARAHATSPTNANYFKILGRDAAGNRDPLLPVYLDLDNLISYMLLNYYVGDGDAPLSNFLSMNMANNWRGMRNRLTDDGFRFFIHDSEHTLQASSWVDNRPNTNAPNGSNRSNFTYSNPEWIHEDLSVNAEYRMRFADLAQKYFFNGGPMTSTVAQALFDARAAQISQAIVPDVARWGTTLGNHSLAQWQSRIASIRASFFPSRVTNMVGYLRTRGFFPAVNAANFTKRGGQVAPGYKATISLAGQVGSIYYTTDGSDPRAVGGAIAGTLFASPGITINVPTLIRMRFRETSTGTWSALDEAYFTTFVPATAGKIVLSKLNYHPTDPTPAELAAGFKTEAAFEYIELQNISTDTLDLRGLNLGGGVTFSFLSASIQSLAPGAKVLIVGDIAAFTSRYGSGQPVAGAFSADLKNSGETLQLTDATNAIVFQLTYSDSAPWPVAADGNGYALVLKNPETNPDPNLATNWRASYAPGGKPGAANDFISIADWRPLFFSAAELADPAREATLWGNNADPDKDGYSNLLEFALGTSPTDAHSHPQPQFSTWSAAVGTDRFLTLTCIVREGGSGLIVSPEASSDLSLWQTGPLPLGSSISQGNGTTVMSWRDTLPVDTSASRFLRLRVQSNP